MDVRLSRYSCRGWALIRRQLGDWGNFVISRSGVFESLVILGVVVGSVGLPELEDNSDPLVSESSFGHLSCVAAFNLSIVIVLGPLTLGDR